MWCRGLRSVTIVTALLSLGACESLRLHDEARAKTAADLVAITVTITEGSEFKAMTENLKPVLAVQTRLQKLEREHDWELFLAGFAGMSADTIADELVGVLDDRLRVIQTINTEIQAASENINALIDDRNALAAVLDDTLKDGDRKDPQKTLERIRGRFAKVRKVLENLRNFLDGNTGAASDAAAAAANSGQPAETLLKIGENALSSAKDDPVLRDAIDLAARAAKELLEIEVSRLREHRRYLKQVRAVAAEVAARSDQTVCHLLLPVLEMVGPGIKDTEKQDSLKSAYKALSDRNECVEGETWQDDTEVRAAWHEGSIASFVSKRLKTWKETKGAPPSPRAAQLVGALGILLYGDLDFLENQELAMARAKHTHSINLSRIHASGHALQVHQLAQGLEVYYRGGIKAEDIAGIFAALAQVGALTLIGVRQ